MDERALYKQAPTLPHCPTFGIGGKESMRVKVAGEEANVVSIEIDGFASIGTGYMGIAPNSPRGRLIVCKSVPA